MKEKHNTLELLLMAQYEDNQNKQVRMVGGDLKYIIKDKFIYLNDKRYCDTIRPIEVQLYLEKEWEFIPEVKETEVGFVDSIKAYMNGSKIRCEYNNNGIIFKNEYEPPKHPEARKYYDLEISPIEIMSKWYVLN